MLALLFDSEHVVLSETIVFISTSVIDKATVNCEFMVVFDNQWQAINFKRVCVFPKSTWLDFRA